MQRILLSVVAVLCFFASAHGQCVKILGTAQRGAKVVTSGISSTSSAEVVYPSATVSVLVPTGSGTLASIYSNATCTVAQTNPMTAASDGFYSFYIASGTIFDIRTSGSGFTTFTRSGYTAPSTTSSGGSLLRVAKLVVTSPYTVLAGDAGKQLVFNNTGAVAVTLAQAGTGSFTSGFWFDVSVVGGGTVTITPTTSTINGASTLVIQSGSGVSGISNDGTNWYGVAGGSASISGNCPTGIVCPDDYGAIHDGSSHLLSSRYSTLVQAQAAFNGAYRFVTSLSQQIDYAAVKAASNAAFGADQTAGAYITVSTGSTATVIRDSGGAYPVNSLVGQTLFFRYYNGFVEQRLIASNTATTITLTTAVGTFPYACDGGGDLCLSICGAPPQSFDCISYAIGTAGEHGYTNAYLNKPLYLPGGNYVLGSDTWLIRNLSGGTIYGAGRTSTIITGSGTVFGTDGLWYSQFTGITFRRTAGGAGRAVDIDGNVPSHPYTTRTVQGNTFKDIEVDGDEAAFGIQFCRLGGTDAQCSENTFINNHFNRADTLVYFTGSNALNNVFLGGNLQDFNTGFLLENASISLYRVAFQSTRGYAQITAGGADIDTSFGNVGQVIIDDASDSESLIHFNASTGTPPIIRGLQQRCGSCQAWAATTAFTLNQIVSKTSVSAGPKLYRVSTAGTSGGIEPTWPNTGTVADGSIVWTETDYTNINATGGSFDWKTNAVSVTGFIRIPAASDQSVVSVSADYTVSNTGQQTIFVDSTAANRTITLSAYNPPNNRISAGQIVSVKKIDTSAHTVTIVQTANGACGANPDGIATVIPGGSVGFATFTNTRVGGDVCWWTISKSFGIDAATLNGATMAIPGAIGSTTPAAGTFTTLTGTTTAIGTGTGTSLALTSFLKVNNTGKLTLAPLTSQTYTNALTIDVTISNHTIAASNTTSATSTWTPSATGSAGDVLFLTTIADASGTVTVTFAATFHPSATQVTTASHYSTICFISTGSVWVELYRTTNLA